MTDRRPRERYSQQPQRLCGSNPLRHPWKHLSQLIMIMTRLLKLPKLIPRPFTTNSGCRITNFATERNLISKSGSSTEPVQESDTSSKPVPLLNNSQNCQPETQETVKDSTANSPEDDNTPLLTITAPQIQEILVRDENRKKIYMPLSSIIELERKKRDAVGPC